MSEEVLTNKKPSYERPKTKTTAEMDDPFEDPSLVTTAFLDVTWQDENGNSALILAAAENRILHVKGILHVAEKSGMLGKVLEIQNNEGLTALDVAMKNGCETAAMLITKYIRENKKEKHRPRRMSGNRHSSDKSIDENDVHCHVETNNQQGPSMHRRRLSSGRLPLSRDKISNRMQCSDYLKLIQRSRSAHEKFERQFSTLSQSSTSGTPPLPAPPPPPPTRMSVGDKLRAIFSTKKHDEHKEKVSGPAEYYVLDSDAHLEPQEGADAEFGTPFPAVSAVRLPPLLALRRRAASETRRRQFIVNNS